LGNGEFRKPKEFKQMSAGVETRCAVRSDQDTIIAILCDAFQNDAVHRWFFQNSRTQAKWLWKLMRETVDSATARGMAIVATANRGDEAVAAALWIPPPAPFVDWWETSELPSWSTISSKLRLAPLLVEGSAYRRYLQMERFLGSIVRTAAGRY
jgi:hypothetical protein